MARESNLSPWPIHLEEDGLLHWRLLLLMADPAMVESGAAVERAAAWRATNEAPRRAEAILPIMMISFSLFFFLFQRNEIMTTTIANALSVIVEFELCCVVVNFQDEDERSKTQRFVCFGQRSANS